MSKDKKNNFIEAKKDHLSPKLLTDIKSAYGKYVLARYVRNIKKIEDKNYDIFGYGSLMNKSDALRTFSKVIGFEKQVLKGYERIFNVGPNGKYLNIQEEFHCDTHGVLITISGEAMLAFILREILYDLVNIQEMYFVIATDSDTDISGEPVLSYVGLCIQGAKTIGGLEWTENLLDAKVYNGTSLKVWLALLNVTNYFIRNDYISR